MKRHRSRHTTLSLLFQFILGLACLSFFLFHSQLMTSTSSPNLLVVAPTFYATKQDPRFALGIQACQQAAMHQIQLLLIDASPDPSIRTSLEAAGKTADTSWVQVHPQRVAGKKGAALRQGIALAKELLLEGKGVIAFQELEKVDMFRHWSGIDVHNGVVAVGREDHLFRETYPVEQYYAEMFGNLYLNSLASKVGLSAIDWTAGPIAFSAEHAHFWIDFSGDLWDAQLVPLVQAHLAGVSVKSRTIPYRHEAAMKEQEEGDYRWNEKRLLQLNFLKDTVGDYIKHSSKWKE